MTDVLCLSAVTIRSQVRGWLDSEGLGVRPGESGVMQLLRGMRSSYKKPTKCVKELHSLEQQHANTHRLFFKLWWCMVRPRCQRRPRRERRRDLLPPPTGASDWVGPPRR